MLARDAYITFGNLDVELSDSYIDLNPGQSVEVQLTSKASQEELQQAMTVTSLADAFPPPGSHPATSAGKH